MGCIGPWRDDVVRMLVDYDYAVTEDTASYAMCAGALWGMETCGTAWEGAHECRFEVSGRGTMSSTSGTMSSTHKYAGSNVSV